MQLLLGFLLLIPYFWYLIASNDDRLEKGKFHDSNEERDYKISKGLWSREQEEFYLETRTWGASGWANEEDEMYYGQIRKTPLQRYTGK